jgi:hypothetical protein
MAGRLSIHLIARATSSTLSAQCAGEQLLVRLRPAGDRGAPPGRSNHFAPRTTSSKSPTPMLRVGEDFSGRAVVAADAPPSRPAHRTNRALNVDPAASCSSPLFRSRPISGPTPHGHPPRPLPLCGRDDDLRRSGWACRRSRWRGGPAAGRKSPRNVGLPELIARCRSVLRSPLTGSRLSVWPSFSTCMPNGSSV